MQAINKDFLNKEFLTWAIIAVILFTIGNGTGVWRCDSCEKLFFGVAYKAQNYEMEDAFSLRRSDKITLCRDCMSEVRLLIPVRAQRFEFLVVLGTISAVVAAYYLFKSFYDFRASALKTASSVGETQTASAPKGGKRFLKHGEWVCSCGAVNEGYTSFCGCGGRKSHALSQEEIESLELPVALGDDIKICERCHIALSKDRAYCPFCGNCTENNQTG